MTSNWLQTASVTLFSVGVLAGCGGGRAGDTANTDPLLTSLTIADDRDAVGTFVDNAGEEIGSAVFTEAPGGAVMILIDMKGLSAGWHGIHLHQVGDCSDPGEGFKASGGHVNPDNNAHGLLNPAGSKRANLPNIYAHGDGRATAELYRTGVSLFPSEENTALNGPYPLLDEDGFTIVVHTNRDDHRTQPKGGTGGRIACAVITAANG